MARKKNGARTGTQAPPGGVDASVPPASPARGTSAGPPEKSKEKGGSASGGSTNIASNVIAHRAPSQELEGAGAVAWLLAIMMFLAPALGVPDEEMIQDTLKSMVVAFGTLGAALLMFWQLRQRGDALRWHAIVWMPLVLLGWALGSMAWSHTYLAGVEAVRWFVFALLLWVGMNTLSVGLAHRVIAGIHWGSVVATFWAVSQFWVDMSIFPQGPNPASTFVNRNFYAEYVASALPLSLYLLGVARAPSRQLVLSFSIGLNVLGILMTGTRSALLALMVMVPVAVFIAWRCRGAMAWPQWTWGQRVQAVAVMVLVPLLLGFIPTGNPRLIEEGQSEGRGMTALSRSVSRVASVAERAEYTQRSFSIRLVMWRATGRMIAAHPITGVGAGAWEVEVPLYQTESSQLETDYYVHNEYLQLLAEYGTIGAAFLVSLAAYLLISAWRTWRLAAPPTGGKTPSELEVMQSEGFLRACVLMGLLSFLIVSAAGFPWRMACTGAVFALSLAMLAASDARVGFHSTDSAQRLRWQPRWSRWACLGLLACTVLAAYISQQAVRSESLIVRAVKIALTISKYSEGQPNHPRWAQQKAEMLSLLREGIAINRHYRKITPMAADELARWGDWSNARWIWESVASSRPHVVALLANIARAYLQADERDQALVYLKRARAVAPEAPAVRSLEIIYLVAAGQEEDARRLADALLSTGQGVDDDVLRAAYTLGLRAKDWRLAVKSQEVRMSRNPDDTADAWLRIGLIHAGREPPAESEASAAFRMALNTAPERFVAAVRERIPQAYRDKL